MGKLRCMALLTIGPEQEIIWLLSDNRCVNKIIPYYLYANVKKSKAESNDLTDTVTLSCVCAELKTVTEFCVHLKWHFFCECTVQLPVHFYCVRRQHRVDIG